MKLRKMGFGSFKSLYNTSFEPGKVNVFIGANGSGKSTILEAIGLLSAAMTDRVDANSLQRKGVRLKDPWSSIISKGKSYHGIRIPGHKKRLTVYRQFVKEVCEQWEETLRQCRVLRKKTENDLLKVRSDEAWPALTDIPSVLRFHFRPYIFVSHYFSKIVYNIFYIHGSRQVCEKGGVLFAEIITPRR